MSYETSESIRKKLNYVRELVRVKNYNEARLVLKTINHPRAVEWLKHLDSIELKNQRKLGSVKKSKPLRRFTFLDNLSFSGYVLLSLFAMSAIFAVGLGIYAILPPTQQNNRDRSIQEQVTDISTSQPLMNNPQLPSATRNTNIRQSFRQIAASAISSYGEISNYTSTINRDGRLVVDVDVELNNSRNSRPHARNVIEIILRLYAQEIEPDEAGKITIIVSWERNGFICGDSAGMGYLTISEINWNNVSQQSIFSTIDRQFYGDDLDGKHYSEVAWAPHLDGRPECNA